MMRRWALVTAWLLAGHALAGALYWWLLHVPESTVWMLVLSALIVTAIVAVLAWVHGGGVLAWGTPPPTRASWAVQGAWNPLSLLVPSLLFLALWWVTGRALAWHVAHAGEMDAWMIARFGWTDTAALHRSIDYLLIAIRWGLGLPLALTAFAATLVSGYRALFTGGWLRDAFRLRRLVAINGAFVLLVVLPWRLAYWRPGSLPPTSAEAVFVSVKLAAIVWLVAAGWAFMLRAARPDRPPA
jgi:hypothetical protein